MSLIKNIFLLISTFIFCYLLLIIGDFIISESVSGKNNKIVLESEKLINKRKNEVDNNLIESAKKSGYQPTLYPAVFDDNLELIHRMNSMKMAPVGGKPFTKTYFCNEGYGLVTYLSDRFGLRNEDIKWQQDIKAVFIGDSFVHGACVDNHETIPSQYEFFSKKNSLNLGYGSNNPLHYASVAHAFIPRLLPEEVFLIFYANDIGKFSDNIFNLFTKEEISIFNNKYPPLKTKEGYSELFDKIQSLEKDSPSFFVRMKNSFLYRKTLPSIRQVLGFNRNLFDPTERAILITNDLCIKYGCNLTVALIPNSEFWKPDSRFQGYRDWLSNFTNKNKINFVDVKPILNTKKNSDDFAIQGPHLSPKGYQKVAFELYSDTQKK